MALAMGLGNGIIPNFQAQRKASIGDSFSNKKKTTYSIHNNPILMSNKPDLLFLHAHSMLFNILSLFASEY